MRGLIVLSALALLVLATLAYSRYWPLGEVEVRTQGGAKLFASANDCDSETIETYKPHEPFRLIPERTSFTVYRKHVIKNYMCLEVEYQGERRFINVSDTQALR